MSSLANERKQIVDLFLISVIGLLLELVVIRWIGSNIKVVSYFSNLVLISSFLGLSLGYLMGRTFPSFRKLFPAVVLLFVMSVLYLHQFNLISVDPAEHFHIYTYKHLPVAKKINFFLIMTITFIINTLLFVPVGQITGRIFSRFDRPLLAYTVNISGNIAAVLIFAGLSFLWTSPLLWFALVFILFLPFLWEDRKLLLYGVTVFGLALIMISSPTQRVVEYWSPYYRVHIDPISAGSLPDKNIGYVLKVDGERHQDSLDFQSPYLAESWHRWWPDFYNLPYRFRQPKKLLILGAGSGNDTYFALKNGVEKITAVEIDPAIIRIGSDWHPHRPYLNRERVTVVNDDGRAFLNNSREKFDMVIFGVLDSHRLASYIAVGLRMDNYIYTKECFQAVRDHLTEDGVVVLQNGGPLWLVARLYNSMKEAFGKEPDVYRLQAAPWPILNYVVSARGAPPPPRSPQNLVKLIDFEQFAPPYGILKDDWPFLYLQGRAIPDSYIQVIFAIAAFSLAAVLLTLRFSSPARSVPFPCGVHFFLMGMAFLLLETVTISQGALLFGCTWISTSAVILAVLVYILGANILVMNHKFINLPVCYLLLFLSLAFCFFMPVQHLLSLSFLPRVLAGAFLFGLPVLFAALIFAATFRTQETADIILGINLLGAVLGGLAQHVDLILGMKRMYLIAMSLYLLSFMILGISGRLAATAANIKK